ncbi:hypothetical protein ACFQZ1_09655 [Bacillus sp. CGMCC 1.60114]
MANALIFLVITLLNIGELETHLSSISDDSKALAIGKWIGVGIGVFSKIVGPIFNLIIFSIIIWLLLLIITMEASFKTIFYTGIKAYLFLLIGSLVKGITNMLMQQTSVNYFSLEFLNVIFNNEVVLAILKSIDLFLVLFLVVWAYYLYKNSNIKYKKSITLAYTGLFIVLVCFNGVASYIGTNL